MVQVAQVEAGNLEAHSIREREISAMACRHRSEEQIRRHLLHVGLGGSADVCSCCCCSAPIAETAVQSLCAVCSAGLLYTQGSGHLARLALDLGATLI